MCVNFFWNVQCHNWDTICIYGEKGILRINGYYIGLNIGKFKNHNFFLFSQDDFWLYPSLKRNNWYSVLNTFILATRHFWHYQQCLFSWVWMLKWLLLRLISSSSLHAHKMAVKIGPHSTLSENISSEKMVKYNPQSIPNEADTYPKN